MNSAITVRNIDPGDAAWIKHEARQVGVSMEDFARRLVRANRVNCERRAKYSRAVEQYCGEKHGVESPPLQCYGSRPVSFDGEDKELPTFGLAS